MERPRGLTEYLIGSPFRALRKVEKTKMTKILLRQCSRGGTIELGALPGHSLGSMRPTFPEILVSLHYLPRYRPPPSRGAVLLCVPACFRFSVSCGLPSSFLLFFLRFSVDVMGGGDVMAELSREYLQGADEALKGALFRRAAAI